MRILDAVADARLGAEVNDSVYRGPGKAVVETLPIGKVELDERKTFCMGPSKLIQARSLQGRVVIVVEVVDADYFIAAFEQGARRRRANEPSSPRDQNSHGPSLGGAAAC